MVVAANGDKEEDYVDVVEAMDPLLTLRPLTTNIEHTECKVAGLEDRFANTSCA